MRVVKTNNPYYRVSLCHNDDCRIEHFKLPMGRHPVKSSSFESGHQWLFYIDRY